MTKVFVTMFSIFMFPSLYFASEDLLETEILLNEITQQIDQGMNPERIRVIFNIERTPTCSSLDDIALSNREIIPFIQKLQEMNVCLIASSDRDLEKTLLTINELNLNEAFQTNHEYKNKIKSFAGRQFHVIRQGHLICVKEGDNQMHETFPNKFFASIFAGDRIPSWVIFFENSSEYIDIFHKDLESVQHGNSFSQAFQTMPITIIRGSLS